MRQIGDQLKVNPRDSYDPEKVQQTILARTEISCEEKEDIARYGKATFKIMMNRVCSESCFSKTDNEYVKCFNSCNLKMMSIKKLYSGIEQSFREKMDAYGKSKTNPFI